MKKLKESIPFIEERDQIEDELNSYYKNKKTSKVDLPKILTELKKLQGEIDELKKT